MLKNASLWFTLTLLLTGLGPGPAPAQLPINEGFDNFDLGQRPVGWSFYYCNYNSDVYTEAGNFGAASPSIKMSFSGSSRITTETFSNPGELQFWLKGIGTDAFSHLLVEECYPVSDWRVVTDVFSLPTVSGLSFGPFPLYHASTQLRFTYHQSNGNLAFDDVSIAAITTTPTPPEGCNLIDEGFDNFDMGSRPAGWTFHKCNHNSDVYTQAGDYGAASPSIKMESDETRITTKTFVNPNTLCFWLKGISTDVTSHLVVEEYYAVSEWGVVTDISSVPTVSGKTLGPFLLAPSTTQLRFTYMRSNGNLAFDDVCVQGAAAASPTLTPFGYHTPTPTPSVTPTSTPSPPPPPGPISGRVYDRDTGQGIKNVVVQAAGKAGGGHDHTDGSGNYEIAGLNSGQYTVFANTTTTGTREYPSQFYNQKYTLVEADQVSSNSFNIHFPLPKGGVIWGRISDFVSGQGVEYISVQGIDLSNNAVAHDRTGSDGNYSLRPFLAGDYKVFASTVLHNVLHPDTCLREQWYELKENFADADTVPVTTGGAVEINLTLWPCGTPSGSFRTTVLDSGDYNGDGAADIAIFRGNTGLWAIRNITRAYFGIQSDIPVSGDYDGDGTSDISIFRAGTGLWAIRGVTSTYFGTEADIPSPGDFDGDGSCDFVVFRPTSGLWALRNITRLYFGEDNDVPVAADYAGTGICEISVFRGTYGLWAVRHLTRAYFGGAGDIPVPGDYDGDGIMEMAIFRSYYGLWAVRGTTRVYFGYGSDYPVPADYTGDDVDTVGIFRSPVGLWSLKELTRVYFGNVRDIPVTR